MLPISAKLISVSQSAAQTETTKLIGRPSGPVAAHIDSWCASLQTRPIGDVMELEAIIRGNLNGVYNALAKGSPANRRKADELKKQFGDLLFADDLVAKKPALGVRFMQEGSTTRETQSGETSEEKPVGHELEHGNGIHNEIKLHSRSVDYLVSYMLQFNRGLCATLGLENGLCGLAVASGKAKG